MTQCRNIYAARKHLKSTCEICGADMALEAHHKDENTTNNDEGNINTLCISCHKEQHRTKSILVIATAIQLPVRHCLRCQYKWFPRKPELPKTCPKCHSPYWDKPRKQALLLRREGETN